jgi:hypothetical protein
MVHLKYIMGFCLIISTLHFNSILLVRLVNMNVLVNWEHSVCRNFELIDSNKLIIFITNRMLIQQNIYNSIKY